MEHCFDDLGGFVGILKGFFGGFGTGLWPDACIIGKYVILIVLIALTEF